MTLVPQARGRRSSPRRVGTEMPQRSRRQRQGSARKTQRGVSRIPKRKVTGKASARAGVWNVASSASKPLRNWHGFRRPFASVPIPEGIAWSRGHRRLFAEQKRRSTSAAALARPRPDQHPPRQARGNINAISSCPALVRRSRPNRHGSGTFAAWRQTLQRRYPARNIDGAPARRFRDVPDAGNQGDGLDPRHVLSEMPGSRRANTGELVSRPVTCPGRRGFIGRFPGFTMSPDGESLFWGVISAVIDAEPLSWKAPGATISLMTSRLRHQHEDAEYHNQFFGYAHLENDRSGQRHLPRRRNRSQPRAGGLDSNGKTWWLRLAIVMPVPGRLADCRRRPNDRPAAEAVAKCAAGTAAQERLIACPAIDSSKWESGARSLTGKLGGRPHARTRFSPQNRSQDQRLGNNAPPEDAERALPIRPRGRRGGFSPIQSRRPNGETRHIRAIARLRRAPPKNRRVNGVPEVTMNQRVDAKRSRRHTPSLRSHGSSTNPPRSPHGASQPPLPR